MKTIQILCLAWLVLCGCSGCNNNIESSTIEQIVINPPTRETIAYVSTQGGRGFDLYLTHDYMTSYQLTWGGFNLAPHWSPDKEWIAYTRGIEAGKLQVWKMKYSGDKKQSLTSLNDLCDSPRWSRDGLNIVYAQRANGRSELVIADSSGRQSRHITTPQVIPFWENALFGLPEWSREGTSIIFSYSRGDIENHISSIGILSLTTSAFTHLSALDTLNPHTPRWSPIRDEIIFRGRSPQGYSVRGVQAYRANSDGSNVQLMSNLFIVLDLDWSTDGESIIFSGKVSSLDDPSEIWEMDRDGKNVHKLISFPPASVSFGIK